MAAGWRIAAHSAISAIPAPVWDGCAAPETADGGAPCDPFTTHRFLLALEDSGSVGEGTGWQPLYLTASLEDRVLGCAPLYVKYHSQGEYIFDYAFAEAFERAGGEYYPKLQVAVPFTPVTGRRFLTHPDHPEAADALRQGVMQLAQDNGLSSAHVTFCTQPETQDTQPFLHRLSQQYHWVNQGYDSFDEFLAALSSRKRKTIRKERRIAQGFGGQIAMKPGADLTPADWDAMWQFYQDTGARKWGRPYLTRAFFDLAQDRLAGDVVMALAYRPDGTAIAGALNFAGRDRLYGRYWGCTEHHPCLHFELCYYQAIDWAIAHRLNTVEAGAQGDHKIARGYRPTATHSLHWFRDPGFAAAVAEYVAAEQQAVTEELELQTAYGPFKRSPQDDHD